LPKQLLKRHVIPAFKLGSDWRFNQESIERWIKAAGRGERSGLSRLVSQQPGWLHYEGKVPLPRGGMAK
jgi:hypothetical protein